MMDNIFGESHTVALLLLGPVIWFVISTLNDPLSSIPGPWYAKYTNRVSDWHWLRGTKPAYVHGLHKKYGSKIIRVGPSEIYTMNPDDASKIHRIKNEFPKSRWYSDFIPGPANIFNTGDLSHHRRLRKALSSPMSESGLKSFLPVIDSRVRLTIQRIGEEYETRGVADVYKWWLFMTTDVIGELSFGQSFQMLESGKVNQYIKDLQYLGQAAAIRTAFPGLYRFVTQLHLPLPIFRQSAEAFGRMRQYSIQSLKRHEDIMERDGPDAAPTVFNKVYKAQGDESMSSEEVLINARAYIVAGSDTTSNSLDYLVWAVCRYPAVKARLLQEIEVLPEDFTYDDLRHVPYLDHVIDEVLRLYATAPAGLPREVPPGGTELSGYHIPAGCTVTTQAYSLHRDEEAFSHPEKFNPCRWEKPTQAMKESFMPFGGGSRICIGLHLAKIELRLAAVRFFRAYPNAKVSTQEGMNDDDMEQELFFLAQPSGHRCLIDLK
ncbi:cytochrome P450 [Xylariaceae sp. FL0255]|nr:cytochrome P450 [Xylariaceae sp. FL0255]